MINLHNTLTRKVQEFNPLATDKITLYACGPTVYDYQTIGNFRKFVFDDTLRRVLQANNYNVQQVMNITDVGHLVSDADEGEDKIEKGAEREGKTVWEVAEYYTNIFKKDALALSILEPNAYHGKADNYARATDFIPQQIDLVKILLDREYAYITEQAIYFDITKLADYGELSGQKLTEKEVGVRKEVVTDSNKKNPHDFALWFFLIDRYQNHTMHWSSPWGDGFPGWHLECSAIIHATLGDPIDIHTGGVDHIGVHHTNEMAQTEAAFSNKLANYWLHSEHLLIDGQKMSKSLGNFYTLKDIQDKNFDPLALRLFYLQGHYRTQINFTWENLQAAQNRLLNIWAMADLRWQNVADGNNQINFDQVKTDILEALNDDLNTPQALSILAAMEDQLMAALKTNRQQLDNFIVFLDTVLGLNLADRPDLTSEQKRLVEKREEARKNQDWPKADGVRDELREQGVEINDTDYGPIWRRVKNS